MRITIFRSVIIQQLNMKVDEIILWSICLTVILITAFAIRLQFWNMQQEILITELDTKILYQKSIIIDLEEQLKTAHTPHLCTPVAKEIGDGDDAHICY